MQNLLFWGEHDLIIDEKNRLTIVSDMRKCINPERDGDSFFVLVGVNRKPWLYPDLYYQSLVSQNSMKMTPGKDVLAYNHTNFGLATKVPIDKQSRVALPDKVLTRTGTQREVTVVGTADHLEVWNRAEWAVRYEELLANLGELPLTGQQIRQETPPRT